jgi:hypothetical protein
MFEWNVKKRETYTEKHEQKGITTERFRFFFFHLHFFLLKTALFASNCIPLSFHKTKMRLGAIKIAT